MGAVSVFICSCSYIVDQPTVISGDAIAYLEPQETIWRGKSGRKFPLASVNEQGKIDSLAPFENKSRFKRGSVPYEGTFFRFPLRRKPTKNLSCNIYSVERLRDLLIALRKEAKFLLLFLRSVHTIKVSEISERGGQKLSFRVSIDEQEYVTVKRADFRKIIECRHSRRREQQRPEISYDFAHFHVSIFDRDDSDDSQASKSHWLVTNQYGSTDIDVCKAAARQFVFPWVGIALELEDSTDMAVAPTSGGRIFCSIPLPDMASSGFPVHVNGTFGINDDRRTLKWPDKERRNDPAADWNVALATKLLPSCYASLLLKAREVLDAKRFYEAWPNASNSAIPGPWKSLLAPLFEHLFTKSVVWTSSEKMEALQQVGEWITTEQGTFIPKDTKLASAVYTALSKCGVKLVNLPPNIWDALDYAKKSINKVSSHLACSEFRKHPNAFSKFDSLDKKELLKYCLSGLESQHHLLCGVGLLPLADDSFAEFQNPTPTANPDPVYLCSSMCPRNLLPNFASLVDVWSDDQQLQEKLGEIAKQHQTQLKRLTVMDVANLLIKECQGSQVVSIPHDRFPKEWFPFFWDWLNNQLTLNHCSLHLFENSLTVPVLQTAQTNASLEFRATTLSNKHAVLLVPSHVSLIPALLSALDKLHVMCCTQHDFPYMIHPELATYLKHFDPDGLLNAIMTEFSDATICKSGLCKVAFSGSEAESLRSLLSKISPSIDAHKQAVLSNLAIFSTTSGALCSVTNAQSTSMLQKALQEPVNSMVCMSHLPSGVILFSNDNQDQNNLLKHCTGVGMPSDVEILMDHVFPLIRNSQFKSDTLMEEVLRMFPALEIRDNHLTGALKDLPFLNGRRPTELFDPGEGLLRELFQDEAKFPTDPFDSYLPVLRQCGLRTTVTTQEIVDIIVEIATTPDGYPCDHDIKTMRATAVVNYIANNLVDQLHTCSVMVQEHMFNTFSQAIAYLAQHFNWLPVAQRPVGYPSCLQWKGDSHESCFTSTSVSTLALTAEQSRTLPYIAGSQVLVVDPPLHPHLLSVFTSDSLQLVPHVLEHFRLVIANKSEIPYAILKEIVLSTYEYLNTIDYIKCDFEMLSSPPWVWIEKDNKFVKPTEVACVPNDTFSHGLEPYVYILPSDLSRYTELFTRCGASDVVSEIQIVAVLEKIANNQSNQTKDWTTVMNILRWLTKDGTQDCPSDSKPIIFVPVASATEALQLVPASEAVYTDNDYLKEHIDSSDYEQSHKYVHKRISPKMAKFLGVQPLDEYLGVTEDAFEDSGQSEPLTTRLRNILRDYKDGLTIIKELLQNADDAEATEVNICYDARSHNVPQRSLFFRGMSECHGPALLVHNNAPFKEEDFQNITKLAGVTKESKALKIGKFGVGFCSVYHITDIPSFVSADRLVIFDPTISYLKEEIKNPSQPGKRVKFAARLIASSQQLVPYKGLFGFNPKQPYDGTLFRLPFRTRPSEQSVSDVCYTQDTVDILRDSIGNASSTLLLFLQHVKRITFQQIDEDSVTGSPTMVLDIHRENMDLPLSLKKNVELQRHAMCCSAPSTSTISESSEYYLVATDTQIIKTEQATASVACLLQEVQPNSNNFLVQETEGDMFCFLSLSKRTGLPVHVSANFAVNSDRRGIVTSSSDEAASETDHDVLWNFTLLEEVVSKAYYALLLCAKSMSTSGIIQDYTFNCLWPTTAGPHPWKCLITSLYKLISTSELFYSDSAEQHWLTLQLSKFLKPGILCQADVVLPCVRGVVNQLHMPIVNLPLGHQVHLNISNQTMSEEAFIELFFKKCFSKDFQSKDDNKDRNEVIRHMLEMCTGGNDNDPDLSPTIPNLQKLMKTHACIPCSPDGIVMKRPSEIVASAHDAKFRLLYDPEDHMFPANDLVSQDFALKSLGMVHETIPWNMLLERAQSVSELFKTDEEKALRRTQLILKCIDQYTNHTETDTFATVAFLPVMAKPIEHFLPWFGEGCKLLRGKELMMKSHNVWQFEIDNTCIAGSQVAFVCEDREERGGCGPVSEKSREVLKICNSPSPMQTIHHFKSLINFVTDHPNAVSELTIQATCEQFYAFFESVLAVGDAEVPQWVQELKPIYCLYNGRKFIEVKTVAKNWKTSGPYLFPIPDILCTRTNLTSALGIKTDFTFEDFRNALQNLKLEFEDKPINNASQQLFSEILPELQNSIKETDKVPQIILPDQSYVLHSSNELVYNDTPWLQTSEEYKLVHDSVPRESAKKLGVVTLRNKVLKKYESRHAFVDSTEFGQREELTRRIQNIIRDYPCDITLLKELLQNADDAKARKMVVILDKRTHGTQSVLSEEWKELQGPALLVWNDSEFSENDLRGIQDLGFGSKHSEVESIGQYGIGFNVVYHLTDCPSFVTGGQTLCVMDPHCRYVPDADPLCPGRRYDNLDAGIWQVFPDMKSTYLRSGLDNCPVELLNGTLFRFPLRHTDSLVKASEKIGENIDCKTVHRYLREWAPKLKQTMLFLNHVQELQLCVIDERETRMVTEFHFKTRIKASSHETCTYADLQENLSAFNKVEGSEPCVAMYHLTLSDMSHCTEGKVKEEDWLIQQGVGDIENKERMWAYVEQVKPRHGIAARLHHQEPITPFSGYVFCFLPLPIECKLPVHINGNFILNSTRKELWKSSDPDGEDDRTRWNKYLFEAIASSYKNFLMKVIFYFSERQYCSNSEADSAIKQYYKLFPDLSELTSPKPAMQTAKPGSSPSKQCEAGALGTKHVTLNVLEGPWLEIYIAKLVYAKLHTENASVLAIIGESFTVETYPIETDSSKQVHFWEIQNDEVKDKALKCIVMRLGMLITQAPWMIFASFRKIEVELPSIRPETVYTYYTRFSADACPHGFPCAVESSAFQSADNFKIFTKYILVPSEKSSEILVYPDSPFQQPLLLTADGQIRCFDEDNKVICSNFAEHFPNSLDRFLHPCLLDVGITEELFVKCSANKRTGKCPNTHHQCLVDKILSKRLPKPLHYAKRVSSTTTYGIRRLAELWKCFRDDPTFKAHLSYITEHWALLLSTDQRLFSLSNSIHPVCPAYEPSSSECSIQIFNAVFDVFSKLKMPFLNRDVVTAEVDCPTLSDYKEVIAILNCMNKVTPILLNEYDVTSVVQYLNNSPFKHDRYHVTSLPLFESIDHTFISIQGKEAFEMPFADQCSVGYPNWIRQCSSNSVFLNPSGVWKTLNGAPNGLGVLEISAEDLYIRFIFPGFSLMCWQDRYHHLQFIRDYLFAQNIHDIKQLKARSDQQRQAQKRAVKFIKALANLHCIGNDQQGLKRASDFASHEVKLFTTFNRYSFLPQYFMGNESLYWIDFFVGIGMKKFISKNDFLQLCREISRGNHDNPRKGSKDLLEYLFSEQVDPENESWKKEDSFLQEVSAIPFVCAQSLPDLCLISPVAVASNTVRDIHMSRFNEAASFDHRKLLWTVRPVVTLPCVDPDSIQVQLRDPSHEDVMENIENISKCSRSSFKLFYQIEYQGRYDAMGLLEIMVENLQFLNNKLPMKPEEFKLLASLPCIPVYNTSKQIVLVKPCCVINSDAAKYYPFLHTLPKELSNVMMLLSQIGVHSTVQPSNIQVALQTAFEVYGETTIDPRDEATVRNLVDTLYDLLSNKQLLESDTAQKLCPLYLPNEYNRLVPSSSLLQCSPTLAKYLTLECTGLSCLRLCGYTFYDHQFCEIIPKELRPRNIFQLTNWSITPGCKTIELCRISDHLKSILQMSILPKAIACVFHGRSIEEVKKCLQSIEVIAIEGLQIDVTFKETQQNLGTVQMSFHFEQDMESCTLYVDPSITRIKEIDLYRKLANHIAHSVGCSTSQVEVITVLLQACTTAEVREVLYDKSIMIEGGDEEIEISAIDERELTPMPNRELGALIPPFWHHKFKQGNDPTFQSMEWVGYREEGYSGTVSIIFAKAFNPVSDPGNDSQFHRICTSENEVKVVSTRQLCKYVPEMIAQSRPNPEEGQRWLKQADVDYRALHAIMNRATTSDVKLSGSVCFQAHQVAEKALKGGLFAECGDAVSSHTLAYLVEALKYSVPRHAISYRLHEHAAALDAYYQRPRYPDRWPPPIIPADKYTVEQAEQAKQHARAILRAVRSLPSMTNN